MTRFDYMKYDQQSFDTHAAIKSKILELEALINDLPEGRARSLIFTKLEEAFMWVGKAIRDDQAMNRGAQLLEQRSNT